MEKLQKVWGWILTIGILELIGSVLSIFIDFPGGLVLGIIGLLSGAFLVSAALGLRNLNDQQAGVNLMNYFILQGVLAAIGILGVLAAIGVVRAF